MMFNTTHEHEALTLYIHSMTASRVLAVATLIAFKMLSENDCLIQANVTIANLLGLSLNQFNLMEKRFMQALAYDASVSD